MGCKRFALKSLSVLFEYDTVKIVSIKSKKIGLMCRFIQLLVITYIIVYVIILQKGYQVSEIGISSVVTKVKGVSYTDMSDRPIWDVADYVTPPQEENAFFITTNALITKRQTQGTCPEDVNIKGAECKNDSDCKRFEPILLGDGVKTGKCIDNKTCEVYAWCPVENSTEDKEIKNRTLLKNVVNFTVFVKNNIKFKKFGVSTSNIPKSYNNSILQSCKYDNDKKCPIFSIGSILREAKVTNYNDIAKEGGVIAFNIDWDCNLDDNFEKCFPKYTFQRLDTEKNATSTGFNFRYANYYYDNNTQYRDLIKAYGIRVIMFVNGKAGKFNIIPLTMNLGSGIALLGIATIICDFFVLYCLNNRRRYAEAKYYPVTTEDAYRSIQPSIPGFELGPFVCSGVCTLPSVRPSDTADCAVGISLQPISS